MAGALLIIFNFLLTFIYQIKDVQTFLVDPEMINFYLLADDLAISGLQPTTHEAVAAAAAEAPVCDPAAPLVEIVTTPKLSASLSQKQNDDLQALIQNVLRAQGTQKTADAFSALTAYINSGAAETHDALTRAIQDMNTFNLLIQKLTKLEKSGKISLDDIEKFAKSMLPPEQAAALDQVVATFNSAQTLFALLKVLYTQVEPVIDPLVQKMKVTCTSCCGSSNIK